MIADPYTNTVFFSELIKNFDRFGDSWQRIEGILNKHKMAHVFLSGTKDIWCRDYMPVQVRQDHLIQFCYEPSYLKGYEYLQSDPGSVLKENDLSATLSTLNVDGGNIVHWEDKAILTTRVFKENPEKSEKETTTELESILQVPVYFIPDHTMDMTGHADGHLRFIDAETLLVNSLLNEYAYWQKGFHKMIKSSGLRYQEMPWFVHKDRYHKETAVGIYVNYLEVGDLIIFPIFEIPGNKDAEALDVMHRVFPDRLIEPVNVNEIAKFGGLLNCCSWTVSRK